MLQFSKVVLDLRTIFLPAKTLESIATTETTRNFISNSKIGSENNNCNRKLLNGAPNFAAFLLLFLFDQLLDEKI